MEISKRFRQDVGYYLLGVIVPGIINALTVPLLKKLLGTAGFGKYGISYNFMLLLAAFSVSWLCQSIIRFRFTAVGAEHFFYRQAFKIGAVVVMSIGVVCFLANLFIYNNSLLFSLLFSVSFFLCGFQNILISVSQANFLARFTMYSEGIRTATFFVSAMILLQVKLMPSIDSLFLALIISYLVSAYLLYKKNKLPEKLSIKGIEGFTEVAGSKDIFGYGLPLAAWYLITYLMLFLDKPALAMQSGYEVQGNYQALYELISKGAVVLMLPVSYAIFPLLSTAYENNDEATGMRLLKKVIFVASSLLLAGLVAYWLFGFYMLQYLLSVPNTLDYKLSGFFMLASTLIWQIGMLVHKPYEIRMQTKELLWIVLKALMVFMLLLLLVRTNNGLGTYRFTLPFLGASVTYLLSFLFKMGHHKNVKKHFTSIRGLIRNK